MSYIGQTSRSLKQKYQEHIRHTKHNVPQLAYALHILNNKHEYGPIKENHDPTETYRLTHTVNTI
jgi:ferritin-like metal-binding protein YciE